MVANTMKHKKSIWSNNFPFNEQDEMVIWVQLGWKPQPLPQIPHAI